MKIETIPVTKSQIKIITDVFSGGDNNLDINPIIKAIEIGKPISFKYQLFISCLRNRRKKMGIIINI